MPHLHVVSVYAYRKFLVPSKTRLYNRSCNVLESPRAHTIEKFSPK